MNEYDLDIEDTYHNSSKEKKIIIKKVNNGYLMNQGLGYSFYFKIEDILNKLKTDLGVW